MEVTDQPEIVRNDEHLPARVRKEHKNSLFFLKQSVENLKKGTTRQ